MVTCHVRAVNMRGRARPRLHRRPSAIEALQLDAALEHPTPSVNPEWRCFFALASLVRVTDGQENALTCVQAACLEIHQEAGDL